MDTKYKLIRPEGMFAVVIERVTVNDTPLIMHYEYKFEVVVRQTQNDFVNAFAALVAKHGKCQATIYADLMGVNPRGLTNTLMTITGAHPREWADTFAVAVAEALLSKTTVSIGKVAEAVGWDLKANGLNIFHRWFVDRYGCSPLKWRRRNSAE